MPEKTLYVIYHKDCGHLAGLHPERPVAVQMASVLATKGHYGFRVRVGGSDEDITAILKGTRCETCSIDGEASLGLPEVEHG